MTRKIRRPGGIPSHPEPVGGKVREIQVGSGLPDLDDIEVEIDEMVDVLLGRVPPPIDAGVLTLMEVADAYFARGKEIENLILREERHGNVFRGSKIYRFRTGELRAFLDLTKRAAELGSRRLTEARLMHDMSHDADGLLFGEEPAWP